MALARRASRPPATFAVFALLVLTALAPDDRERAPAPTRSESHLRIDGTRFLTAEEKAFQWRGITAFRLLDYVADGQEAEARRYLAWAKAQDLTLVRVFAMLDRFFDLAPDAGRRRLPVLDCA